LGYLSPLQTLSKYQTNQTEIYTEAGVTKHAVTYKLSIDLTRIGYASKNFP